MAQNCDPQSLVNSPNVQCIYGCIPPGMQLPVLISLLCQIVQNGTGGGGSGTVTSFSAGNLSPLFTTSVATATTTPALTFALSTQTANTLFAGPTSGGASGPTFRAMVNADIPTTLTPQITRLGIGTAVDAAAGLKVLIPGAAGNQFVAQFNSTAGNPYILVGGSANGFALITTPGTNAQMFIAGGAGSMFLDSGGNVNLDTGIYKIHGNSGVSGTFDATNTVTVEGGIITNIA